MAAQSVESMPPNWEINRWPPNVFPHEPERARSFVRRYQKELIECGALTRIGRIRVVLGAGYAAFLEMGRGRVEGYEANCNKAKASAEAA